MALMRIVYMTITALGLVTPLAGEVNLRLQREGDCNPREKKKYEIMFCKSMTCTVCCDIWCKDTCAGLKDAMDSDDCKCDKDPEAFTSDTFCKEQAEKYHEDHKDDVFEEQMARACVRGCKECCKDSSKLVQVNGSAATKVPPRSMDECNVCLSGDL